MALTHAHSKLTMKLLMPGVAPRATVSALQSSNLSYRGFSTSWVSRESKAGQTLAVIPWAEYFKIRRSKHRWEVATTIPTSLAGFCGGLSYFGSLEAVEPIMGFDPLVVYGIGAFACTALGWLIGPMIGGTFWRLSHRRALKSIETRDRQFYEHIVRNRVDPQQQSANNLVPDYYGEKVGSMSQYRTWLRDQSKFRKKALLPEE